jgi:cell wall-associated NlpC family hydrolase
MKKKGILLEILAFVWVCFLILTGCSSTSSSLRYKNTTEIKEDTSSSIKFSSEQSQKELAAVDTNINFDSLDNIYFLNGEEDPDDIDDIPEEDESIDLTSILNNLNASGSTADLNSDGSNPQEKMLMEIIKYLNTPYKYGGNSSKGIDCSAFTQTIFKNTCSFSLLRSARDQFTQGQVIENGDDIEFGDLVFFNTRRRVRPGHVGIYIGNRLFAHASSKRGVIISSMDHDYYSKRYMGARRLELVF